jgi:hypothetical protein
MMNDRLGRGQPPSPAGLCAGCVHARAVATPRGSVFVLCERSKTDPRFPRYPHLPVVACAGYEPASEAVPGRSG